MADISFCKSCHDNGISAKGGAGSWQEGAYGFADPLEDSLSLYLPLPALLLTALMIQGGT